MSCEVLKRLEREIGGRYVEAVGEGRVRACVLYLDKPHDVDVEVEILHSRYGSFVTSITLKKMDNTQLEIPLKKMAILDVYGEKVEEIEDVERRGTLVKIRMRGKATSRIGVEEGEKYVLY